jgi:glycine hydroxymethyltransferase
LTIGNAGTKLKDFKDFVKEGSQFAELQSLKQEIKDFAKNFPTIGFSESTLRYK